MECCTLLQSNYMFEQAKQREHLVQLLGPELEKSIGKEDNMVKELEQLEQEGKDYMVKVKGMKERLGSRLCQISGFLGLKNEK